MEVLRSFYTVSHTERSHPSCLCLHVSFITLPRSLYPFLSLSLCSGLTPPLSAWGRSPPCWDGAEAGPRTFLSRRWLRGPAGLSYWLRCAPGQHSPPGEGQNTGKMDVNEGGKLKIPVARSLGKLRLTLCNVTWKTFAQRDLTQMSHTLLRSHELMGAVVASDYWEVNRPFVSDL